MLAQSDWVDWAEELGIQPSLEAIKAGETAEEKGLREKALDDQTKTVPLARQRL